MQLRTVKKPKNKAFDFGRDTPSEQPSGRKTSFSKDQGDKDGGNSSAEVRYRKILIFFINNLELAF
jgi:hypothetical protein